MTATAIDFGSEFSSPRQYSILRNSAVVGFQSRPRLRGYERTFAESSGTSFEKLLTAVFVRDTVNAGIVANTQFQDLGISGFGGPGSLPDIIVGNVNPAGVIISGAFVVRSLNFGPTGDARYTVNSTGITIHEETFGANSWIAHSVASQSAQIYNDLPDCEAERLRQLEGLTDDWDSRGSKAPGQLAIDQAREVLRLLREGITEEGGFWVSPHITVAENGEITFEWWAGSRKLTVYCEEQRLQYLRTWGTNIELEFDEGDIASPDVFGALWHWLFQHADNRK